MLEGFVFSLVSKDSVKDLQFYTESPPVGRVCTVSQSISKITSMNGKSDIFLLIRMFA